MHDGLQLGGVEEVGLDQETVVKELVELFLGGGMGEGVGWEGEGVEN